MWKAHTDTHPCAYALNMGILTQIRIHTTNRLAFLTVAYVHAIHVKEFFVLHHQPITSNHSIGCAMSMTEMHTRPTTHSPKTVTSSVQDMKMYIFKSDGSSFFRAYTNRICMMAVSMNPIHTHTSQVRHLGAMSINETARDIQNIHSSSMNSLDVGTIGLPSSV